jgi:hypothetical protein
MTATRRDFLRNASTTLAGTLAVSNEILQNGFGVVAGVGASRAGRVYNAEVPDTLDLADQAKLALNGLGGTLDWEHGPEFYFRIILEPPELKHDAISFAACGPKFWEAFPMMRLMSGSDLYADLEKRHSEYLVSCIQDDGLFYCKIGPERPWDNSSPEDYANIYGQGRMIRAMLAQYYYDGNREWLARLDKMFNRLAEIAIYKDDYAYYPNTPGYGDRYSYPKSGWKVTELKPETLQSSPNIWLYGHFGIPMYLGGTILPLVRYAEQTQSERAMDLAGKLVRFVAKPENGWNPESDTPGVNASERAHYPGQFHAHVMALRGILAYGVAVNDTHWKNFARDGYEFSRTLGIARLGWFEGFVGKHSHESCGLADMVSLAIKLTEAGMGDYWDDVDGYTRNHLTEGRHLDLARLKEINPGLTLDQEKILERCVGTFTGYGRPTALSARLQNCCMANGAQGLYSVWESMLKFQDGTVQVNLLLNRASPWLDVDSSLPHEGKVVIHNKQARRVLVCIPRWVNKNKVRCSIDGNTYAPLFVGNYLLVEPVRPGAAVVVTFPIQEETESFTLEDWGQLPTNLLGTYTYNIVFRGNTAVKVVPNPSNEAEPKTWGGRERDAYPIYPAYQDRDREKLRSAETPTRKVDRVIADKIISSW